ncbi:tyrosine-type recombinase/integrase [Companilactobacillus musae]|uniref:tyrosine-type recombinase/integrase n=1 Tax=Companilactobacillus musae TaxID=1903258 RepID=UPI001FE9C881|nr:site-specific integrase [Companilactobacillus musae]
MTFYNYFKKWVTVYKAGRFTNVTKNKYSAMEKFILKHFGNTKLKKITKIDYQKMLDEYAQNHVKTTVSALNGAIRSSLKDALEEQIISIDFTRDAIISGEKKSKEIKFFELDEANKIRSYCLSKASVYSITRYEIALALATGLRYAEIAGLTWNDIDFDKNTIDVNKTYDYKKRTGFKPTKTASSVRILDVDQITMKMLKHLKIEQAKVFLKQKYSNDINYVFMNGRHQIPGDAAANKALGNVQTKLNIKNGNHLTFHALRHTHASILISRDISLEYVSARLGHSSTLITSQIYVHLLKDRKEQDAKEAVSIFN